MSSLGSAGGGSGSGGHLAASSSYTTGESSYLMLIFLYFNSDDSRLYLNALQISIFTLEIFLHSNQTFWIPRNLIITFL